MCPDGGHGSLAMFSAQECHPDEPEECSARTFFEWLRSPCVGGDAGGSTSKWVSTVDPALHPGQEAR